MRARQKKTMWVALAILAVALISLAGALIVGKKAEQAGVTVSTPEERTSAISESGFSEAEQAGIEAMIHDYIIEHPEVITEGLAVLNARETRSRLDAAGEGISQPYKGAYLGNKDASITLVEFTDYSCGFCRRSVADIEKLVRENDDLRVVFREAPILKPESRVAALWALAAAEQGKYEAFHHAMFEAGPPDDEHVLDAAKAAGMDIEKARQQVRQPEYAAELNANIEAMRTIGVSGTPTFLIGDEVIEGAVGYEQLQDAIDEAREG